MVVDVPRGVMTEDPLVVLAAPGASGAAVAAALGAATGRPTYGHDETDDVALDTCGELRTWCRRLLWASERDWVCADGWTPDAVATDGDGPGVLAALCDRTPPPVLHDPALPFLLPAVAAAVERVGVVVVVRDPRRSLPRLVFDAGLLPGHADDLLRATHARLRGVVETLGVPVVDLDAADAPARLGAVVGGAPLTISVDRPRSHGGVEPDADVRALLELAAGADEPSSAHVTTDAVAAAALVEGFPACDRFAGPRTAARRSELRTLVGPDAVPPVLECTRATGVGAATADDPALAVATVGSIPALRRAVTRPVGSLATVLLPDLLTWCTPGELEVALRLVADRVDHGGGVVVGTGRVVEEERAARGLPAVDDADLEVVLDRVGLVPVGRRTASGVGAVIGSAQARSPGALVALRREVERLGAAVDEARRERDDARARFEALRSRRSVRAALSAADRAGALLRLGRDRDGRG